ncbi:MAG: hypothetical protein JKY88_06785 [Pseudomonadales bacterium]|nr:hypothetical protein [Pseudomonadales bacterium]
MKNRTKRILITGFSPFDGRKENASLIASTAAKGSKDVTLSNIEIPVEWGSPRIALANAIKMHNPEIIIGLGEGHVGEFNIETTARNVRRERIDNLGNFPLGPNYPGDLDTIKATIDVQSLLEQVNSNNDIPIKISSDAGGFICEETLYTLEKLRNSSSTISAVVFIHLPPFESMLTYQGQQRQCDENLLLDFTRRLIDGILILSSNDKENKSFQGLA